MIVRFDFEDSAVRGALDGMSVGKLRGALRSGLRRAMSPVRGAAVRAYRSLYPGVKWKLLAVRTYKRGVGVWLGLHKLRASDSDVRSLLAMRSLNRGTAARATRRGYGRGSVSGSGFFDAAVSGSLPSAARNACREVESAVLKRARKEGLL